MRKFNLNKARTGSIYFDLETENKQIFSIRISDHTKINYTSSDFDVIDKDLSGDIIINIFSNDSKKEALKYIKNYFALVPKIKDTDVFVYVPYIKPAFTISDDYKILFLKHKIDITKSKIQVKEQIIKYLLSKKITGILTKKEYEKSRGLFRLKSVNEIKGVITWIATTGGQVTINGNTGKDFRIDNKEFQKILSFL